MHFASVLALLACALSLTAAIPHARNFQPGHYRLHAHKLNNLEDRSILNGICGGVSGDKCEAGYCCSEWGYCGKTDQYCGAGCQSLFGTCDVNNSTPNKANQNAPVYSAPAAYTPSSVSAAPAYTSVVPSFSAIAPSQIFQTSSTSSSSPPPPPSYSPAASSATTSAILPVSTGTGSFAGYVHYTGNGTPQQGWPTEADWMSFDDLWTHNLGLIANNCDNSDNENAEVKSAISSISAAAGIPANFVFAIILQESKACVRVVPTFYSVVNPGLMQSHDGHGSCNNGKGTLLTPCPGSMITQMVSDGVDGTQYVGSDGGAGLTQLIAQAKQQNDVTGAETYYTAARLYNSGSASFPAGSTNLVMTTNGATVSYPADIANRLMGWIG